MTDKKTAVRVPAVPPTKRQVQGEKEQHLKNTTQKHANPASRNSYAAASKADWKGWAQQRT